MCDLGISSVSFAYEGALIFRAYIFSTEICSSWIFHVTNMKCPSVSLLIDFTWKSILLDIRKATPACFLGPFDWKIFPNPL